VQAKFRKENLNPVPGIFVDLTDYDIANWEQTHHERNMKRMFKTEKNYRCPRREALMDYRHHRGSKWWHSKERKWIRTYTVRRIRRKLKQHIDNEIYYNAHPHDYKTYGWLTW